MARIMCTQRLWHRLGHAGRPPIDVREPVAGGATLGSWAARVSRFGRQDLVIGLNERTYLTVVFPLAPRASFHSRFAGAVADALRDLRLTGQFVQSESAAVEFAQLARLTNRSMTGTLNDLDFFCGIELSYHDDLRIVQLNLNQIPHARRDPCVPADAVHRLFGSVPVQRSLTVH